MIRHALLPSAMTSLRSKVCSNWSKESRDIRKVMKRYPYYGVDLRCQGHASNLCFIAHYFQNTGESLKKIGSIATEIAVHERRMKRKRTKSSPLSIKQMAGLWERRQLYGVKKWRPAHINATISVAASIFLEENFVQIGLFIADTLLCETWPWPTFSRSVNVTLLFPATVSLFWWKSL